MTSLLLTSLEVKNFRAFRHLQIGKLGRVNLIVGRNNVGKSCLLQALELYASRGNPAIIGQVMRSQEDFSEVYSSRYQDIKEVLSAAKHLFHGRKDITNSTSSIEIGPATPAIEKLFLSIRRRTSKGKEEKPEFIQNPLFNERESNDKSTDDTIAEERAVPQFLIQFGEQPGINVSLKMLLRLDSFLVLPTANPDAQEINCIFTKSHGLNNKKISALWDKIALTDHEKDVIAALSIIAPGIEAISTVGNYPLIRERITIVKVQGITEPLPIRNLGDGMQRLLGIALALVNARDGLLLIDEIENGLHYSTHTDLWRLIFQLARKLNVQVFATSHSWDCITAFSKAAQEDGQNEGMLIRLDYKNGDVKAALYDKETLNIATQQQIEVR
jgi:AAA15 family ATPase/GTPase